MNSTVIEQIKANLFRAEIPLPRNPLKATNSYIIRGKDRNLVIDTGMKREECKTAMLTALTELDVDLTKTDFFITHLHADHVGLVADLSVEDAVIYFNKPDAEILNFKGLWQVAGMLANKHGFPSDQVIKAIDSHPGQKYSPSEPIDFTMVQEGDLIQYGGYELYCVVTPGHTRGHTCLYEPNYKLLFSGDHILGDITPNISTWLDDDNPLAQYLESLDKVYGMSIDLVLPGHRSLITDSRQRIDQLREHHRDRLEEVMKIIAKKESGSAFQIASHMTWDLVAESWDEFPLMQKWFATGEALAHIIFLEKEGKLKRNMSDQTLFFSPA